MELAGIEHKNEPDVTVVPRVGDAVNVRPGWQSWLPWKSGIVTCVEVNQRGEVVIDYTGDDDVTYWAKASEIVSINGVML